jgi:hypothetical protein
MRSGKKPRSGEHVARVREGHRIMVKQTGL